MISNDVDTAMPLSPTSAARTPFKKPAYSKVSDFYHPLIEIFPAAVIAADFVLVLWFFPKVLAWKAQLATMAGESENFQSLGILKFLVPGLISLIVYVILFLAQARVAAAKEPMRSSPPLTAEQQVRVKRTTVRGLLMLKIFVPAIFLYLTFTSLQTAAGIMPFIGAPLYVLSALAAGAAMYIMIGVYLAQRPENRGVVPRLWNGRHRGQ